ncbi:MAG: cupin domain-containing protein [Ruminococcus sp.]|nr:cupin domain-containing protein [Ruminococcus sp.]
MVHRLYDRRKYADSFFALTGISIWYAVKGRGVLLLADNKEKLFEAGDVVRFGDGDIHGLHNDSDEEFIYISVTRHRLISGMHMRKRTKNMINKKEALLPPLKQDCAVSRIQM